MANYYHEARAQVKKLKKMQEEGAKRRDLRRDAKAEAGVVRARLSLLSKGHDVPRRGLCWTDLTLVHVAAQPHLGAHGHTSMTAQSL